jgi:hypothetical protein
LSVLFLHAKSCLSSGHQIDDTHDRNRITLVLGAFGGIGFRTGPNITFLDCELVFILNDRKFSLSHARLDPRTIAVFGIGAEAILQAGDESHFRASIETFLELSSSPAATEMRGLSPCDAKSPLN